MLTATDYRGNIVYRDTSSRHLRDINAASLRNSLIVMVRGSFGYGCLGVLVFLHENETMYENGYYTLLNEANESSIEKTGTPIFQRDGARCHTAKFVTSFLHNVELTCCLLRIYVGIIKA